MGGCFWQKRKSAFGTFRDQNLVFLGLGDIRLLGQKTTRTKDYPDIRPPGHITTMSNTKRQYVTKIWFWACLQNLVTMLFFFLPQSEWEIVSIYHAHMFTTRIVHRERRVLAAIGDRFRTIITSDSAAIGDWSMHRPRTCPLGPSITCHVLSFCITHSGLMSG